MRKTIKTAIFLLITSFMIICHTYDVLAAQVQNIRLSNQNGSVARVVLDISEKPDYQISFLKDPYRIVIDLNKTTVAVPKNKIPKSNKLVTELRLANSNNNNARIVVETPEATIVKKEFTLPPQSGFPWRLVLDIANTSDEDFLKAKAIATAAKANIPPRQTELTGKAAEAVIQKLEIPPAKKPLIVIDPGHGGKDPGAISTSGFYEKHITLRMAKVLKDELDATHKYRTMLTRNNDIALALRRRVKIAHDAKADIFISIHADSAKNTNAKGLSVYTLSERASDKESAALAASENKADAIIGVDFSDKEAQAASILIDMVSRETMNSSHNLATNMVKELSHTVRTLPDTHRFAGFAVLKAQDIPSVLVEIGYLSNREEERLIRSNAYRIKMAKALTKAINQYFADQRIVED